jgi:hypothetical protein
VNVLAQVVVADSRYCRAANGSNFLHSSQLLYCARFRENSVTRTLHENQILRCFPEGFVLVPTVLCIMSQGSEAQFLYMMARPWTDSRNLKCYANKHDVQLVYVRSRGHGSVLSLKTELQ